MRRIALLIVLSFVLPFLSACSDSSGHIENGRFYAPDDAFDVAVPYPPKKELSVHPLETQAGFSEFEDTLNFQIRFGDMHRLERFKIGAPHFDVDRSKSARDQLEQAEAEFSSFLKRDGFHRAYIVDRQFKRLGNYDALIDVYAIPNIDPTNYRGVAFVITPHYVMLLQHSNPKYTEKDAPAIAAEVERFYSTIHLRKA